MKSFLLFAMAVIIGAVVNQALYAGDNSKAVVPFAVEAIKNVAYYDGPDADPVKHKLDLYLPKGHKDFPVVFFIHGGGWKTGDKSLYGKLGNVLCPRGIGVVITNYRLSPKVRHPAHMQDVAKSFAWTYRHIAKYGGRPDAIFVMGHSAGGHLAALLATDQTYLKANDLSLANIKGAIPISGVYRIRPGRLSDIFAKEEEVCRQASPITFVTADPPPFLILYADKDFTGCDKMSEEFCQALRKNNRDATTQCIKDRDHISIIKNMANTDDPTTQAVITFVGKITGLNTEH